MSSLSDTKVVTFGGCHSEYVHMNEMHIFDCSAFLSAPSNIDARIQC